MESNGRIDCKLWTYNLNVFYVALGNQTASNNWEKKCIFFFHFFHFHYHQFVFNKIAEVSWSNDECFLQTKKHNDTVWFWLIVLWKKNMYLVLTYQKHNYFSFHFKDFKNIRNRESTWYDKLKVCELSRSIDALIPKEGEC